MNIKIANRKNSTDLNVTLALGNPILFPKTKIGINILSSPSFMAVQYFT